MNSGFISFERAAPGTTKPQAGYWRPAFNSHGHVCAAIACHSCGGIKLTRTDPTSNALSSIGREGHDALMLSSEACGCYTPNLYFNPRLKNFFSTGSVCIPTLCPECGAPRITNVKLATASRYACGAHIEPGAPPAVVVKCKFAKAAGRWWDRNALDRIVNGKCPRCGYFLKKRTQSTTCTGNNCSIEMPNRVFEEILMRADIGGIKGSLTLAAAMPTWAPPPGHKIVVAPPKLTKPRQERHEAKKSKQEESTRRKIGEPPSRRFYSGGR